MRRWDKFGDKLWKCNSLYRVMQARTGVTNVRHRDYHVHKNFIMVLAVLDDCIRDRRSTIGCYHTMLVKCLSNVIMVDDKMDSFHQNVRCCHICSTKVLSIQSVMQCHWFQVACLVMRPWFIHQLNNKQHAKLSKLCWIWFYKAGSRLILWRSVYFTQWCHICGNIWEGN